MARYTLEDGFEFVTNEQNLVVATKYPGTDKYNKEKDAEVYVIGSIPKNKKLDGQNNVSNPPKIGEYLVVRGEPAPPSASPLRIATIDDYFPK